MKYWTATVAIALCAGCTFTAEVPVPEPEVPATTEAPEPVITEAATSPTTTEAAEAPTVKVVETEVEVEPEPEPTDLLAENIEAWNSYFGSDSPYRVPDCDEVTEGAALYSDFDLESRTVITHGSERDAITENPPHKWVVPRDSFTYICSGEGWTPTGEN